MTFRKLERVAMRLTEDDAEAVRAIVERLRAEESVVIPRISDVLRYAL
jgi:hypothetical protein